jgi:hypothetical protein
MGNALKRARRAKHKAKQNRIERHQRMHHVQFESDESDFVEEIVCDDPEIINFFKTLPCPVHQTAQCLSLVEGYVNRKLPELDEDEFVLAVAIHAAMYKNWVLTGEASFVINS